jgi:hypothetical protein
MNRRFTFTLLLALAPLAACKRDASQNGEAARMTALADEMCTCRDAACARTVQAKQVANGHLDPAESDAYGAAALRFNDCYQRHVPTEPLGAAPSSMSDDERQNAIEAARGAGIID